MNNQGKMKRELTVELESIQGVTKKVKAKRRRDIFRKLTVEGYSEHFQKPQFGGYSAEALQLKWVDRCAVEEPADCKGVIKGVGGQKRYQTKVLLY